VKVAAIVTGPTTGYRIWRLLPFQDLEGPPSVRLCSAGTMGVPKFWPVREPVVAVCSKFKTTHAAPWPTHECGVWALPSLEAAEKRIEGFATSDNFRDSLGWAVGEVALWGRVIEHENGFRAQYAYPVALTVTSRREHTARVVALAYGIPVEWKRRYRSRPVEEQNERAAIAADLAEATARLAKVRERLKPAPRFDRDKWLRELEEQDERNRERMAQLPPLEPPDVIGEDELLVSYVGAIARDAFRSSKDCRVRDETMEEATKRSVDRDLTYGLVPSDVGHVWLWQRFDGSELSAGQHTRRGYRAVLYRTLKALTACESAGLVAGGKIRGWGESRRWFLTSAGFERTRKVCAGVEVSAFFAGTDGGMVTLPLDPILALIPASGSKRELFDLEREYLVPRWMEERRRAQARGPEAYARWLKRARKGDPETTRFTEDETFAAIVALTRKSKSPVTLASIREELAPGATGHRLGGESAQLSSQLLRLLGAGRVKRIKQAIGPNLWLPA
jgi:hypothetical protein